MNNLLDLSRGNYFRRNLYCDLGLSISRREETVARTGNGRVTLLSVPFGALLCFVSYHTHLGGATVLASIRHARQVQGTSFFWLGFKIRDVHADEWMRP